MNTSRKSEHRQRLLQELGVLEDELFAAVLPDARPYTHRYLEAEATGTQGRPAPDSIMTPLIVARPPDLR